MPLRAIDIEGTEYLADEVDITIRNKDIRCPFCNVKMLWVNPPTNRIKHFRHKTTCPYQTEPETLEHRTMKKEIYDLLLKDNTFRYKHIEHKIGNRIADIFLILLDGTQIAIECQCSILSEKNIEHRTKDYTQNNIYVLWILGTKKYQKYTIKDKTEVIKTKNIERWLHQLYSENVYYYDINTHEILKNRYRPFIVERPDFWEKGCVIDVELVNEKLYTQQSITTLELKPIKSVSFFNTYKLIKFNDNSSRLKNE